MDVQFEWNKILFADKETDYSHCKMWWINNSTSILNVFTKQKYKIV